MGQPPSALRKKGGRGNTGGAGPATECVEEEVEGARLLLLLLHAAHGALVERRLHGRAHLRRAEVMAELREGGGLEGGTCRLWWERAGER